MPVPISLFCACIGTNLSIVMLLRFAVIVYGCSTDLLYWGHSSVVMALLTIFRATPDSTGVTTVAIALVLRDVELLS